MKISKYKLINIFYSNREKFLESVLYLFSFSFIRFYLLFLFIFNFINWALAFYVNKNISQNLAILHYNVNLGVNLIGNASNIYIIPTIGMAFIFINFLLLLNIYNKKSFLIHLLFGFTLLINLFLIAGTVSIYLINFR